MPHLIKKIVNAFDRSGKKKSTDLKFRGQKMSLENCMRYGNVMVVVWEIFEQIFLQRIILKKNLIHACVFFWQYK